MGGHGKLPKPYFLFRTDTWIPRIPKLRSSNQLKSWKSIKRGRTRRSGLPIFKSSAKIFPFLPCSRVTSIFLQESNMVLSWGFVISNCCIVGGCAALRSRCATLQFYVASVLLMLRNFEFFEVRSVMAQMRCNERKKVRGIAVIRNTYYTRVHSSLRIFAYTFFHNSLSNLHLSAKRSASASVCLKAAL